MQQAENSVLRTRYISLDICTVRNDPGAISPEGRCFLSQPARNIEAQDFSTFLCTPEPISWSLRRGHVWEAPRFYNYNKGKNNYEDDGMAYSVFSPLDYFSNIFETMRCCMAACNQT